MWFLRALISFGTNTLYFPQVICSNFYRILAPLRHDRADMALVNDIIRLQKYPVKLLLQLMNLVDDFVHVVLLNIRSYLSTACCLKKTPLEI